MADRRPLPTTRRGKRGEVPLPSTTFGYFVRVLPALLFWGAILYAAETRLRPALISGFNRAILHDALLLLFGFALGSYFLWLSITDLLRWTRATEEEREIARASIQAFRARQSGAGTARLPRSVARIMLLVVSGLGGAITLTGALFLVDMARRSNQWTVPCIVLAALLCGWAIPLLRVVRIYRESV